MGLRDRAPEFEERDATILGVSFDTPEDNAAFAEKFDFPFALLSDLEREVSAAYGAAREPDDPKADRPRRISYVIDPAGTVRAAYVVQDAAAHPQELLDDLRQLQDC